MTKYPGSQIPKEARISKTEKIHRTSERAIVHAPYSFILRSTKLIHLNPQRISAVPSGLFRIFLIPGDKSPGYSQMSLRGV